jgi:hypothetical protein
LLSGEYEGTPSSDKNFVSVSELNKDDFFGVKDDFFGVKDDFFGVKDDFFFVVAY